MSRTAPKPWDGTLRAVVRAVLFFTAFYLYLWLRVNPALIYYGYWRTVDVPFFSTDPAFFSGFLAYPGGLVDYVSAFFSQLYAYGWAGSLLITLIAGLLCLTTWLYLPRMGGRFAGILPFVPAVILLLMYGRYGDPMPVALALLAAMACACLYVALPARRARWRLLCFLALGGGLYYVAAGAVCVYAFLCGVFEAVKKRWPLGVVCVVAALGVLGAVGIALFRVDVPEGYPRLMPGFPKGRYEILQRLSLLLFFPVAAAAVAVHGMVLARRRRPGDADRAESPAADGPSIRRIVLDEFAGSCACLVVAAIPVLWSFDAGFRALLRTEFYARHSSWASLLAQARRIPLSDYDEHVRWHVNRALYHTGRLPEGMFSYPQDVGGLVPTPQPRMQRRADYARYMKYSDILIELGLVNESERVAHEALEVFGDRPSILQRLALVNIVKGQTEAALVFLGALGRDPVHRAWARERVRRLRTGERLADEDEIRRVRSMILVRDELIVDRPFEEHLLRLLEDNGQNRMAFEYLMAHYLLNRNLVAVARHIGRLDDFDYAGIPRHYEEALLIHMDQTGEDVDLHGRTVRADTRRRLDEFRQVLARHGNNTLAAVREALPEYGDTYFFYHAFGLRGRQE